MDRIVVNPQIHFGKPIIKGTRITVQNVLELINEGLGFDQIIKDYYPDLKKEDIQACLQYAIALVASEDIHISSVAACRFCSIRMCTRSRSVSSVDLDTM